MTHQQAWQMWMLILCVVFGGGGLVLLIVFWDTIGGMKAIPRPPWGDWQTCTNDCRCAGRCLDMGDCKNT